MFNFPVEFSRPRLQSWAMAFRTTFSLPLLLTLLLPFSLEAEELLLSGPAGPLAATLVQPEAVKAAALILPGSGPTDRNGNAPGALAPNSYALLADALSAKGIASLRADKRGIGQSGGDANAVTLDAYAADAAVLAGELRQIWVPFAGLSCWPHLAARRVKSCAPRFPPMRRISPYWARQVR
jgi:hypothetical protein